MKNYLFYLLVPVICFFPSCLRLNSENEMEINDSNQSTEIFINKISALNDIYGTKSGDLSEEEAIVMMAPLLEASKEYLQSNDYDFEEDFETPDDPRITWVALAVAEYDLQSTSQTKSTLGGCVLEALGVKEIINNIGEGALKKAALKKRFIKPSALPISTSKVINTPISAG